MWRTAAGENAEVIALLEATIARLRAQGATVVDNVELPVLDEVFEAEFPALLVEFKHDINAYLAATPGRHPRDLAGLIEFNRDHADIEMPFFGQEIFEEAQATSGDLTDPAYLQQRATATNGARRAIDETMASFRLDAILAPTNNAAWVTNLETGDDFTDFCQLLHTGGGGRLPEHHGAGRVRARGAPARHVVLRRPVQRTRADRPGLLVRAGDPGAPPTGVPAHPAVVRDHGCSRRRPRTAGPLVALGPAPGSEPQGSGFLIRVRSCPFTADRLTDPNLVLA